MSYNYERFHHSNYELAAFPGPRPGDDAPDFTVTSLRGKEAKLSNYAGSWVVLETGSLTSSSYTRNIKRMCALSRKHRNAVFLVVYTREAHPGSRTPHHRTQDEKIWNAGLPGERLGEQREMLVDDLDGSMHLAYGGLPNMVYVISPSGEVVYRHDWNVPKEIDEVLNNRDELFQKEHATIWDIKAFGPRNLLYVFTTTLRGGWNALWDMLTDIPTLTIEYFRADQHYRLKQKKA